jgi:hypothetical protein
MVTGQGRKKRHGLLGRTKFQIRFSLIGIAMLVVVTMNFVAIGRLSENADTEGVNKLILQDSVRSLQNSPRRSNDKVRDAESKGGASSINKRLVHSSGQSTQSGQKNNKYKNDDKKRPSSPKQTFNQDLEYRITFPWKQARGVVNLSPLDRLDVDISVADFDGIQFESIRTSSNFERQIGPHDGARYEKHREKQLREKMHDVVAQYDNDPPLDETDPCRRNAWMDTISPTCNTLHEIAYGRPAGSSGQNWHMQAVG